MITIVNIMVNIMVDIMVNIMIDIMIGVWVSPGNFFQISRGFFFRIRGLYSKTHKARSSNHAERVRAPTFFQHGKVAIL